MAPEDPVTSSVNSHRHIDYDNDAVLLLMQMSTRVVLRLDLAADAAKTNKKMEFNNFGVDAMAVAATEQIERYGENEAEKCGDWSRTEWFAMGGSDHQIFVGGFPRRISHFRSAVKQI